MKKIGQNFQFTKNCAIIQKTTRTSFDETTTIRGRPNDSQMRHLMEYHNLDKLTKLGEYY